MYPLDCILWAERNAENPFRRYYLTNHNTRNQSQLRHLVQIGKVKKKMVQQFSWSYAYCWRVEKLAPSQHSQTKILIWLVVNLRSNVLQPLVTWPESYGHNFQLMLQMLQMFSPTVVKEEVCLAAGYYKNVYLNPFGKKLTQSGIKVL